MADNEKIEACIYNIRPAGIPTNTGPINYSSTPRERFIHLTIDIQVADSPNCHNRVRTAATLECTYLEFPNSRNENCGFDGYARAYRTPPTLVDTHVYIGSTGDDGIVSMYSAWTDLNCDESWRGSIYVSRIAAGGQWFSWNREYKMERTYSFC